ncbi:MAG: hypothetical protein M0R66_04970 [Candidatus Omnitrophica bacterium]|nr:hypothetical protein [Candidatus Omnitrophota bacterium]
MGTAQSTQHQPAVAKQEGARASGLYELIDGKYVPVSQYDLHHNFVSSDEKTPYHDELIAARGLIPFTLYTGTGEQKTPSATQYFKSIGALGLAKRAEIEHAKTVLHNVMLAVLSGSPMARGRSVDDLGHIADEIAEQILKHGLDRIASAPAADAIVPVIDKTGCKIDPDTTRALAKEVSAALGRIIERYREDRSRGVRTGGETRRGAKRGASADSRVGLSEPYVSMRGGYSFGDGGVTGGAPGGADRLGTVKGLFLDKLSENKAEMVKRLLRILEGTEYKGFQVSGTDTEKLRQISEFLTRSPVRDGKSVCAKLAREINNVFGVMVIDPVLPPGICATQMEELLASLSHGVSTDFYLLGIDINRDIKNITKLVTALKIWRNAAAEKMGEMEFARLSASLDTLIGEFERYTNLMNAALGKHFVGLPQYLAVMEDNKSLARGDVRINDRIDAILRGIVSTGSQALAVANALRKIGMDVSEYKAVKGPNELYAKFVELVPATKLRDSDNPDEYFRAAQFIAQSLSNRDAIASAIEDRYSAAPGGDGVEGSAVGRSQPTTVEQLALRRLQSTKNRTKILVNSYGAALQAGMRKIRAAIDSFADAIGTTVPLGALVDNFVDLLRQMVDIKWEAPRMHLALLGYYRDATAQEVRARTTSTLKQVATYAETIIKDAGYAKSKQHFEMIRDAIRDLIIAVDQASDNIREISGGDGNPRASVSDGNTPRASDDDAADDDEGASREGGNDSHGNEFLKIRELVVRDKLRLIDSIEKADYMVRVAQIKSNLGRIARDFQSDVRDYDTTVLGPAVAARINKLNTAHNYVLRKLGVIDQSATAQQMPADGRFEPSGIPAQFTQAGEYDFLIQKSAGQSEERMSATTSFVNEYYAAIRGFWESAQAIELYLKYFTNTIITSASDVQDISMMIREVDVITRMYDDAIGDDIAAIFEVNFPGNKDLGNYYTMPVLTVARHGHYFEWKNVGAMPFTQVLKGRLRGIIGESRKALAKFAALKNLISFFVHFGSKIGGADLRKMAPRTPLEIYNGLIQFMSASAFVFGFASGEAAGEFASMSYTAKAGLFVASSDLPAQDITRTAQVQPGVETPGAGYSYPPGGGGDSGTVYGCGAAQALSNGVFMRPYQQSKNIHTAIDPNTALDLAVENQVFSAIVKALGAKVLVLSGMHDLINRPHERHESRTSVRMIVGAGPADSIPKIESATTELYVRLPLLALFYKKYFRKDGSDSGVRGTYVKDDSRITLLPDLSGSVFSDFIAMIFRRFPHVDMQFFTDNEMKMLVAEINRIYSARASTHATDVTRGILGEFVRIMSQMIYIISDDDRKKYDELADEQIGTGEYDSEDYQQMILASDGDDDVIPKQLPSEAAIAGTVHRQAPDSNFTVRGEHWRLIRKFRCMIDQAISPASIISLRGNILATQVKLGQTADDTERFRLVCGLVRGTGGSSSIDNMRQMIFVEVMGTGLGILSAIYTIIRNAQLAAYVTSPIQIATAIGKKIGAAAPDTGAAIGHIASWLAEHLSVDGDGGDNERAIAAMLTTVMRNDATNTRRIMTAVNTDGDAVMRWSSAGAVEIIQGSPMANDNVDRKSTIQQYCFHYPTAMITLLETISALMSHTHGFVRVNISDRMLHVDFGALQEYVRGCITSLGEFANTMRPHIRPDIMKRYTEKRAPGSLYWLQEQFVEKLFDGRRADGGQQKYRTLSEMASVVRDGFTALMAPIDRDPQTGNKLPTPFHVNYTRALACLVAHNSTSYGDEERGLYYRADVLANPFDAILIRGSAGEKTVDTRFLHSLALTSEDKVYTDNHGSILFSFNKLLAMFLRQMYDTSNGKIFSGLIDTFARGAFNHAILKEKNTFPDHLPMYYVESGAVRKTMVEGDVEPGTGPKRSDIDILLRYLKYIGALTGKDGANGPELVGYNPDTDVISPWTDHRPASQYISIAANSRSMHRFVMGLVLSWFSLDSDLVHSGPGSADAGKYKTAGGQFFDAITLARGDGSRDMGELIAGTFTREMLSAREYATQIATSVNMANFVDINSIIRTLDNIIRGITLTTPTAGVQLTNGMIGGLLIGDNIALAIRRNIQNISDILSVVAVSMTDEDRATISSIIANVRDLVDDRPAKLFYEAHRGNPDFLDYYILVRALLLYYETDFPPTHVGVVCGASNARPILGPCLHYYPAAVLAGLITPDAFRDGGFRIMIAAAMQEMNNATIYNDGVIDAPLLPPIDRTAKACIASAIAQSCVRPPILPGPQNPILNTLRHAVIWIDRDHAIGNHADRTAFVNTTDAWSSIEWQTAITHVTNACESLIKSRMIMENPLLGRVIMSSAGFDEYPFTRHETDRSVFLSYDRALIPASALSLACGTPSNIFTLVGLQRADYINDDRWTVPDVPQAPQGGDITIEFIAEDNLTNDDLIAIASIHCGIPYCFQRMIPRGIGSSDYAFIIATSFLARARHGIIDDRLARGMAQAIWTSGDSEKVEPFAALIAPPMARYDIPTPASQLIMRQNILRGYMTGAQARINRDGEPEWRIIGANDDVFGNPINSIGTDMFRKTRSADALALYASLMTTEQIPATRINASVMCAALAYSSDYQRAIRVYQEKIMPSCPVARAMSPIFDTTGQWGAVTSRGIMMTRMHILLAAAHTNITHYASGILALCSPACADTFVDFMLSAYDDPSGTLSKYFPTLNNHGTRVANLLIASAKKELTDVDVRILAGHNAALVRIMRPLLNGGLIFDAGTDGAIDYANQSAYTFAVGARIFEYPRNSTAFIIEDNIVTYDSIMSLLWASVNHALTPLNTLLAALYGSPTDDTNRIVRSIRVFAIYDGGRGQYTASVRRFDDPDFHPIGLTVDAFTIALVNAGILAAPARAGAAEWKKNALRDYLRDHALAPPAQQLEQRVATARGIYGGALSQNAVIDGRISILCAQAIDACLCDNTNDPPRDIVDILSLCGVGVRSWRASHSDHAASMKHETSDFGHNIIGRINPGIHYGAEIIGSYARINAMDPSVMITSIPTSTATKQAFGLITNAANMVKLIRTTHDLFLRLNMLVDVAYVTSRMEKDDIANISTRLGAQMTSIHGSLTDHNAQFTAAITAAPGIGRLRDVILDGYLPTNADHWNHLSIILKNVHARMARTGAGKGVAKRTLGERAMIDMTAQKVVDAKASAQQRRDYGPLDGLHAELKEPWDPIPHKEEIKSIAQRSKIKHIITLKELRQAIFDPAMEQGGVVIAYPGATPIGTKELPSMIRYHEALHNLPDKSITTPHAFMSMDRFEERHIPDGNHVLFASLGRMLNNILTSTDERTQMHVHILESAADIPSYLREKYRAQLPFFRAAFDTLARKCDFYKQIIEHMDERCFRSNASDSTAFGHTKDLSVVGYGFASVAMTAKITGILQAIATGSSAIVRDCSRTLSDIGDQPRYFETSSDSIGAYRSQNGFDPIMPLSALLRVARGSALRKDEAILPMYGFGDQNFKYQYAIRGLFHQATAPEKVAATAATTDPLQTLAALGSMVDVFNKFSHGGIKIDLSAAKTMARNIMVGFDFIHDVRRVKAYTSITHVDETYQGTQLASPEDMPALGSIIRPRAAQAITVKNRAIKLLGDNKPSSAAAAAIDFVPTPFGLSAPDMSAVIDIVEGRIREDNIKRILDATIPQETASADVIAANIVDMNIMPFDLHVLARQMPLHFIWNYAFTFDSIAGSLLYDRLQPSEIMTEYFSDCRGSPPPVPKISSARDALFAMLSDPYRTFNRSEKHWLMRMLVGATGVPGFARPKFLSDQLAGKILLGDIITDTMPEVGPPSTTRGVGVVTLDPSDIKWVSAAIAEQALHFEVLQSFATALARNNVANVKQQVGIASGILMIAKPFIPSAPNGLSDEQFAEALAVRVDIEMNGLIAGVAAAPSSIDEVTDYIRNPSAKAILDDYKRFANTHGGKNRAALSILFVTDRIDRIANGGVTDITALSPLSGDALPHWKKIAGECKPLTSTTHIAYDKEGYESVIIATAKRYPAGDRDAGYNNIMNIAVMLPGGISPVPSFNGIPQSYASAGTGDDYGLITRSYPSTVSQSQAISNMRMDTILVRNLIHISLVLETVQRRLHSDLTYGATGPVSSSTAAIDPSIYKFFGTQAAIPEGHHQPPSFARAEKKYI